jgi:hypothetical protein
MKTTSHKIVSLFAACLATGALTAFAFPSALSATPEARFSTASSTIAAHASGMMSLRQPSSLAPVSVGLVARIPA